MRGLMSILVLAAAAVVAGTLWGCNDKLDDPTQSEGIITVESVDPPVVEADVTAVDPNGNPQTLTDDIVNITLKNRPRVTGTGSLADVFIKRYSRCCIPSTSTGTCATASIVNTTTQTGFTISSGGSASVPITAVTVQEKTLSAAVGDTWLCQAQFFGEDAAGNPAKSDVAGFSISFGNF